MNAPASPTPVPSVRGFASSLGALAATALVALALTRALAAVLPEPPKQPFDDRPLLQMRKAHFDLVFLGNSMLGSRIDGEVLNRLIAPRRAAVFVENGSGSAVWYLQLKNQIIASGTAPRRVVVFFRGQRLTLPRNRTQGRYLETLERHSHEREPHLERMLAGEENSFRSFARRAARAVAPIRGVRTALEQTSDRVGFALANAVAKPLPQARRRHEINELFAWQKLRPRPDPEPEPEEEVSGDALPPSFLPEMLRLARENDIELFFVHVQKRPRGGVAVHSAAHRAYLERLAAWLEANGAGFRDLTGADWVPESWYARSDHIDRAHRAEYTRLFVEHVPEAFE